ncbi:hypothetical protein, partial [uncultured Anaerovibrio sp.]|uniref:hypothetical protein n=1 Tax=uncultured Anaerovibrio sp. TaxID=361586 RepID=UPI00261EB884
MAGDTADTIELEVLLELIKQSQRKELVRFLKEHYNEFYTTRAVHYELLFCLPLFFVQYDPLNWRGIKLKGPADEQGLYSLKNYCNENSIFLPREAAAR